MSKFKSNSMKIVGISAALPKNHSTIYELGEPYFDKKFMDTINKTVGVENIYYCSENQSSGDLGYSAAEELLNSLEWDRASIDALIFISQSLDYVIPPTSAKLQYQLGLSSDIFIMDSNYGCAGFVMGLMIASQFIESGNWKRALIINAECHRRFISNEDRDSALLFSDAASAVAVERAENFMGHYITYVDGSHMNDISLGLYKNAERVNTYGKQYSYMNGEVVTQFMLRNVPKKVKELLNFSGKTEEQIDSFLFHQANAHMVKYISRRMGLDLNKVPINITNFANTSSVSIPLLICDKKQKLFSNGGKETVMMFSFGAGFTMGGTVLDIGKLGSGNIIFV